MRPIPAFLTLALLLLPAAAAADLCDDIATGADNWAEIADRLDALTAEGVPSAEEAADVDATISANLDPTLELVALLVQDGNGDQQRLGRALEQSVASLGRAETFGEIIAALDDLTDRLDAVVDDCDAYAESAGSPAAAAGV